jgi:predicted ribosomally synthesized peptide with nif11-like leader
MSIENVIAFWRLAQDDQGLRQRLEALKGEARDARPETVVKMAAAAGLSFSSGELLATEAVLAFWERVKTDAGLQAQLAPLQSGDDAAAATGEIAKIAQAAGFQVTAEQIATVTEARVASGAMELDESQLQSVVGGARGLTGLNLSLSNALKGKWAPNFRIGPGTVAEYM